MLGDISVADEIYIVCGYTNMRRSSDGLCGIVQEKLRHTRAIHLYRGGMPLALLSEFLGHASIETTKNDYTYADTENEAECY